MAKKLPTYKAVKQAVWDQLKTDGWHMSRTQLKVPWADHPTADLRVWFKPQAIYTGWTHKLGDAWTLTYDDLRAMGTSFIVRLIYTEATVGGRWPNGLLNCLEMSEMSESSRRDPSA